MASGIHQFLFYSLPFIDKSQYATLAHASSLMRDIIMQYYRCIATRRETIFEAVERAARQSRATMLEQNTSILARFPSIRGIAITWAYFHDDVQSLRVSCMSPHDNDVILALRRIMIHVPYNSPDIDGALTCTIVRASGIENRMTLENIEQILSPRCISYMNICTDLCNFVNPLLAQVDSAGNLIYVRNDEYVVNTIYNIFGPVALQQYIVEHVDTTICNTNLNERSYAIRAILRSIPTRKTIEWISSIVRTMVLIPTDAKNARVIDEILRLINNTDITMKLLSVYFRSMFFSPELFRIMTHESITDEVMFTVWEQYNHGMAFDMTCASIGILLQWASQHDMDDSHIESIVTESHIYSIDDALTKTSLAYVPTKTIIRSRELLRATSTYGCEGTIMRVNKCMFEHTHMKPYEFRNTQILQIRYAKITGQLISLAVPYEQDYDSPSDEDSFEQYDVSHVRREIVRPWEL